jgi:hypothetical protein
MKTDPYLTSEDVARKAKIAAVWEAYNDEFPKPLKVEKGDDDDNIINNRCSAVVDTGVTFLFGNKLEIQVKQLQTQTETDPENDPMQVALDAVWGDMDDRMTFMTKLGMNGGIAGQVFVKVIPPDQTEDGIPRLINLDPACMTIQTKPDDCDTIVSYSHEYRTVGDDGKETNHREITKQLDNGTWEITQYEQYGGIGSYTQIGEPLSWPYSWAPIHTCQNMPMPNVPWGKPDITPGIIQMNKQLNFIQSNTSRILHKHAHPWPWASGITSDKIQVAPGRVICIPVPDGSMGLLETNGAGLTASREFAADLRGDMDEQTGVPAVAVGRISEIIKGQVSGIAIKLMFAPLIAKTNKKRRLYGWLICEISEHCLELMGFGADIEIDLHWEDPLPEDVLSEAQAALLLDQLGVSKDTNLSRLGFDPDEEAEKKQQEDAKAMQNFNRGQGMMPPMMPPEQQPNQQQPSMVGGE